MHCESTIDTEEKCSFVLKKQFLTLQFPKNNAECFPIAVRINLLNKEQHCPLVVEEIF